MEKLSVHVYQSSFTHETRILKETASLVRTGLVQRCLVIATWAPGLKAEEALDSQRQVWRIRTWSGGLKYRPIRALALLEWFVRSILKLRSQRISVLHCHSLVCLPACVVLKLMHRCSLVYDAHELETEATGVTGARQFVSKILERALIGFADSLIVVSDSIGKWYQDAYESRVKNLQVIRNIPAMGIGGSAKTTLFRDKFSIPKDHLVFTYNGLFFRGRGIEQILQAFAGADPVRHVVFLGSGALEPLVRSFSAAHPNIHFHPAVSPGEVIQYTSSADAGLCVFQNTCLSHYYSLPNKLFEYLASGLPVIVSDFPDSGTLIDRYGCGWKVMPEPEAIRKQVEAISWTELEARRDAVERCRRSFSWAQEEEKLLSTYSLLMS